MIWRCRKKQSAAGGLDNPRAAEAPSMAHHGYSLIMVF